MRARVREIFFYQEFLSVDKHRFIIEKQGMWKTRDKIPLLYCNFIPKVQVVAPFYGAEHKSSIGIVNYYSYVQSDKCKKLKRHPIFSPYTVAFLAFR